jgi:PQQ-dependent dehydrogenase (methanol/ethanol family)
VKKIILVALYFCFASLAHGQGSTAGHPLLNPGDQWPGYGRDYAEQRFSPQDQIDRANVDHLGLAWSFTFPTHRVMESTPLMHDGKLYVTTPWSHVFALDARSGEALWHFNPEVNKAHLINSCCGPANRGAALWQEGGDNYIYVGSFDGRLIALNADSGEVIWSVQTVPENKHYTITGAPRVIDGKVIIGNGGAELGVRGYITAYDALTGEQLWRFYTVPGDPAKPQESQALEDAVASWTGEWWKFGGGGTVWDAMAYDPALNLLYIGTGNGSPWNRNIRSPDGGDNLYLNSIVAINPDNGDYVWHYQVTPKDNWDYTATQHLMLAELDLNNDGNTTPVIMQAPKNGFFYVLDRRDGTLLSADAYAHINWASHVDMATGKPVENPVADYNETGGSLIWPAPFGAHNWQPMAFNPGAGLVYIPEQRVPGYYTPDDKFSFTQHRWNTGVDFWGMRFNPNPLIAKATNDAILRGYLSAWDPVTQRKVWQVEHPKVSNGGVLATAGELVFQGTGEGGFYAYDASNGERLWGYQTDSAVLAGPISYALDGEQYIAVTQGSGGSVMLAVSDQGKAYPKKSYLNPNRLLVFKLQDQKAPAPIASPALTNEDLMPPTPPAWQASAAELLEGEKLYERNCTTCHGIAAVGGNIIPDLRYMDEVTHREFQAIVLAGLRSHKGMVGFYETLGPAQIDLIHGYLIERNHELVEELKPLTFWQQCYYWIWYGLAKLGEAFPWLANATYEFNMTQ